MKKLLEKYKDKGFRLTLQRMAILEFLEGNRSHPTAEDIYTGIREKYPTISMATVYNNIQKLKEEGYLQEILIEPHRKHYDPDITPHHHIICIECKKIEDIFTDYRKTIKLPEGIKDKFILLDCHINFYGLCKDCQAKASKNIT